MAKNRMCSKETNKNWLLRKLVPVRGEIIFRVEIVRRIYDI